MCMTKQLFDLHTHSSASDGSLSPVELVQKAKNEGVFAIAITDHDTVSGIDEGKQAAKECGISFIPGIELNIQWHPGEFHLLGLNLKTASPSLSDIIASSCRSRVERNEKIAALMRAGGVDVSMDELASRYPDRPIGRPHFADYLVEKGVVRDRQRAFDKYLGKGRPWYVERAGANMDEAIQAIVDSGGIPILAHPMSLHISWGRMAEVLDDIKERGIEGLEAWHPSARENDCKRLEKMAVARGFLLSAGSDYHGEDIRQGRRLAHTAGGHCITSAFISPALLHRCL